MKSTNLSLVSAGAGAVTLFLLDPVTGRRRRALIRDQVAHAARKAEDLGGAMRRDLRNRWQGARSRWASTSAATPVSDDIVTARVRAALGRVASHARAISVSVHNGRATLTGDTLVAEAPAIVEAVRRVEGVDEVDNRLTAHSSAEGVPSLQGRAERPDHWSVWLRSSWSPAAKLAVTLATAGIAAAMVAVSRADPAARSGRSRG